MADSVDVAAAVAVSTNDNNVDDVEDLYADLDEQVAAALAAAGESDGSNARDSDPVTDGEGEVPELDENEAVDLGDGTEGYSSSDEESDDGLRIVLNEDTNTPLPPPPVGRGEGCLAEDEEGDDTGNRVKGSSVNDGGWATVGGLQCKGLIEKTPLPIMGQIDRGHQHVFQRDYNFSLPRNSTIFDIDIEAFQQKPWRQQGVDLTDYFNFSLDEEGWRKYWTSMKQLRLGARSLVNETLGLEQESYKLKSVKAMSKVTKDSGSEGRNGLGKPKGRAILVEGSACERVPSADLWRPIQRDSDVVIEVNMTLSPSNQSTSDDSSKLNHKDVATERVVDKEVHDGGSSEGVVSKLDRGDSYFARDQSHSPDYSDMLSGESKENHYFKRSNRHSDFRDFFEDTKLQDEHVKSDFNSYSSKSDTENSESCSHGYTHSVDDRKVASKLSWRGEAPFAGRYKSGDLFVGCNSDRDLKSRHKTRKGQRRQTLDDGRNAIFVEKEKPTDSYPSRYDRKYEKRRSSSPSLRTKVCSHPYEQRYSPIERIALKKDKHYFSNESNYHHRQSLSCDISEGEDVDECFSSANERQRGRDHIYHSMVKTDTLDADDGRMFRGRYSQEKRTAIHDRSMDVELSHYTDYRFCEWQSPEVRGRYRDKGRFAKSNDGHFRHANHLELYPGLNNSEGDRPATGFPYMSSRNRCINNKKVSDTKMAQNNCHGYHQKNKQHDSSFCIGNIPRSALRSDTFAETGQLILPMKRKLHSDPGSMDQKTLADLPLLKGRRLMHGQSIVSDRKIYALKLHKSTEKINTQAICSSSDMRNSNTVPNICFGRRHELDNADNIHLNDRKIKFERQGNELRRVIENNQKGPHSVDKDLPASRHKHVHHKPQKQKMGHCHSGNQDLDKSADQKWLNEDVEIEEGELIEEDHHDIISKGKLKPRNVLLKSVIETSSADQLQCISFWPEDGRPYVALGKLYSKQSRYDKARAVYERGCQATQGENPYIWQCWAVLESKSGNIRRARELFDAATVADAKHIAAWHGWAILEIKQGNIKKARNLLGKALKYCGGNEYIYQTLALLEAKAERFEQARTLFEQATQSNPKSCASWLAWAQIEMCAGNNTMARNLFEKAVQASPKNRFSWHVWALFEANEGNIDRARKLLKIGHAVNPRDPVILQSLALLEYNFSSANVARVLFRKASQIDPRHQPVWIAWGWMEWKEGNARTARALYQRALSVNSTNECAARCLQAWGVLEQRAGNYTAARRLLRSSLNINSQSEVTWMTWAALEEEQGDPVRAEEIRNLYFQQRTEVVDDASWVMGFLDIIDPALDSVKKLLNLDQPSGPARQDDVKSTARSAAARESSETSVAVGSDTSGLTSNDAGNNGSEATGTPTSDFDLDGFIKRRLALDAAELDAVLEGSDPRGVVSQRRKQRLPRKPLPLLPVP